jgi:hypothetical protein
VTILSALKEVKNEIKEVRVRVAALEMNMHSISKPLQQIELSGKTDFKKVQSLGK